MAKKKPIRKHIDNPDVPMPQVWKQFIAHDQNKADLASFLSDALITRGKELEAKFEVVTDGGFTDPTLAVSTRRDTTALTGNHEEADTRMILHAREAVHTGYDRVLVISQDTDVLVLLVHFLSSVETWMVAGTAIKRKCYPVHKIGENLTSDVKNNIISFHTLTGCDTTSSWKEIMLEGVCGTSSSRAWHWSPRGTNESGAVCMPPIRRF